MTIDRSFWRGKRVFLTGHTGFKGSWLSLWLQELGAELQGFALEPPTEPSLFELARVADGMASTIGDIRDFAALHAALQAFRPEIVIHMAAQPLVRPSYAQPVETYAANVMGTVHLLESVRQTPGVKSVVVVTTDKCYENREWVWGYREDEPMGGHDPYSNSKGCAELVTAAYRASFLAKAGVAVGSARAGNVIGGGDWAPDRLIPDFFRAAKAGRPLEVRFPDATRPWQHVLEPLSGYLMLAEQLFERGEAFAEPWNFGPGEEDAKPVRWLLDQLTAQLPGTRWHAPGGEQLHEANFLKLDSSKARARLHWAPRWTLSEALHRTVDWHLAWTAGGDLRSLCVRQIASHQAQAAL
jgi:CDP-glucose 4,6-dehydratase